VCGYRLQANRPAPASSNPNGSGGLALGPAGANQPQQPRVAAGSPAPANKPVQQQQAKPPRPAMRNPARGDEMYLGQTLNNRFKIESKIGEGGFGAVYRGTQLATGRKVALKLLHPEMTNYEYLVARFRREGMVVFIMR
jgi:serine/threonine-protein kinase